MIRGSVFLAMASAALAVLTSAAWGHGDIRSTQPEANTRVRRAPHIVRIVFTETPTRDGRFEVLDGCGEDLLSEAGTHRGETQLGLHDGQPGTWTVSYRVISSVDGHPSRGSFSFTVAGKPDCGAPNVTESPDDGAGALPPDDPANGGAIPLVPIAIGGGVIVALAIAVRMFSSR